MMQIYSPMFYKFVRVFEGLKQDDKGCIRYWSDKIGHCRTTRYVYSTKFGWIDFHHVFRVFEWAIGIEESGGTLSLMESAVEAHMMGYGAEVIQYVGSDLSGFSYEDLCSNHIGAVLFLNSYNVLKGKESTWADQLRIAAQYLSFVKPSDAPNYEFIPYLLDGNVPRVFSSSSCLTGEGLRNQSEAAFRKKRLETQLNTKSVHYEFPD